MYRISIACVTACFLFLGCGGPSATDLYEFEKRVSAIEKSRGTGGDSLNQVTNKVDALTDQLATTQQKIAQRLNEVENALSEIKTKLSRNDVAAKGNDTTIDASAFTKLEARIMELESEIADLRPSPKPERSLIPERDLPASQRATMDEVPDDAGKTSKTDRTKSKSKRFDITLLSWNVESEGSDPVLIAKQLSEMNRYDVYGLCEVLPESIELFVEALGRDYRTIASRSGFNDRLQIIYNTKKFRLLRRLELQEINFEYRYRSPLVAHLQHKATGQQIMVMNNHLARGRAAVRTKQASQLVEWAREQRVPIVAIGDYNFDYVFRTRTGNDGFAAMLRDNIWQWVEPAELIDTQWFDNPNAPDGRDDFEGSMLDFAFVAGAAAKWKKECRIIVRSGDFPDDETTSDHRPFELRLTNR